MNTKLVNTAADAICRAMKNGKQTPAGIAFDLESAQLLQSPETAAELTRLRRYVETRQSREEELLAAMGRYDLINTPDAWDLGMTVIAHLEGPHRPSTPEELEPGLRRLIEQLRARVDEVERAYTFDTAKLKARVAELEAAAIEGRAALAALCHDLEDPGSNAFGALFLLQQATPGTPMEPGENVPTVYRAEHDSIVMGLYMTAAAAREHCETLIRRDIPGAALDWIEDEEDGVAELVAAFGEDERPTGYIVTSLEVASRYDAEADE
ncbi:hypothetical protein ABZ725_51680 [Streptomyces sp. NPDC006872]|uniref:hypothetical protein n=1 Tax=Streptomyces sp. NPDC006872 TaxID=3155720 RepID=UPI0033C91CBF